MKKAKQLERHFKGLSNHNRIKIILYLSKNSAASVEELSDHIGAEFSNTSQHTRRLVNAGLINKRYEGRTVFHSLSPYGKKMVEYLKDFRKL